jgi:nitrogen fixation/metabolism regulation signal transduction histidine kinase
LAVLLIFQIIWLIYFVEKGHKHLAGFLDSIRYNDFSSSFSLEGEGAIHSDLKESFNSVIKDFQKIRAEKEEQFYFLQNIIHHIGIVLVGFKEDGTVILVNNSASKLFSTKELSNINDVPDRFNHLFDKISEMKNGENSIVKVQIDEELLQLNVFLTEFKMSDEQVSLVSIQNIQEELDEKEMDAWQKLIRVLTHEIMNSITPISSISTTINTMIADEISSENQSISSDILEDITEGLETIHKRSTGLIHFVDTYRNLTKIPIPNFTIFYLNRLFRHLENLLEEDLKNNNINLRFHLSHERLEITADEELVEQILINLIKNAKEALIAKGGGTIMVSGKMNELGRIIVSVKDDGPGIIPEVLDKIFIPFFTTKPKGSGIGLSLTRQIMRSHRGTISVLSMENEGTTFVLKF